MTGPGHAACWGYPAFVHFQDRAYSTLWGAASNTFFSFFVLIYHLSLSAAGHGRDMLWPQQSGNGSMNSPYTMSSYT